MTYGIAIWVLIAIVALAFDLISCYAQHTAPKPTATQQPIAAQSAQSPMQLASRSGEIFGPPAPAKTPSRRIIYEGVATVTAYTGTDAGMDGRDINADGTHAVAWQTVAAWDGVPFGSIVEIPELGRQFIVADRGGAIGWAHVDVYVGHANVEDALQFGRKQLHVKIYAPVMAR